MDELHIEDGSNDKAYFTMVPNIVLNHSSAVDQALYMQMKRFAGEKSGGGYCTASKRTLMGKLRIGLKALNESIEYLVSHGWISPAGVRKVMTSGGSQDIQIFRVNDIWKLNTEHYKGASESAPLYEGVPERTQGVLKSAQGVPESTPTKNNTKIDTSELEDEVRVVEVSSFEGEEKAARNPAKYPNARNVFKWFTNPQPSWKLNKTELAHAELLHVRGEQAVRGILSFAAKYQDDPYFPSHDRPSALEANWSRIIKFADRNGL